MENQYPIIVFPITPEWLSILWTNGQRQSEQFTYLAAASPSLVVWPRAVAAARVVAGALEGRTGALAVAAA